jgi:hypothetical protein
MGKLLLAIWVFLGSLFGVNHQPTTLPATKAAASPDVTRTPTFIDSEMPNKLVVTRPEDRTDHLSALTVTITDEEKVRKLFEDIYLLPTYAPGSYNCPSENFSKYRKEAKRCQRWRQRISARLTRLGPCPRPRLKWLT